MQPALACLLALLAHANAADSNGGNSLFSQPSSELLEQARTFTSSIFTSNGAYLIALNTTQLIFWVAIAAAILFAIAKLSSLVHFLGGQQGGTGGGYGGGSGGGGGYGQQQQQGYGRDGQHGQRFTRAAFDSGKGFSGIVGLECCFCS